MRLDDFHVDIPQELIAQEPLPLRDASRLLVCRRHEDDRHLTGFGQLPEWLDERDLLIFNDTRVIPARLLGRKRTGGNAEIFLLRQEDSQTWQVMLRGKRLRAGTNIIFDQGIEAHIQESAPNGTSRARFNVRSEDLFRIGHVPLPPYIQRDDRPEDQERYQSVLARHLGAVAAPTASLHFTPELLHDIDQRGIDRATLTLHVGLGTFAPIRTSDVRAHRMHTEWYQIPEQTIEKIRAVRQRKGRLIAVGTTVLRALESAYADTDIRTRGETDIFIYPGYNFRITDGLITNFHLPESTLMLLVCAFQGTRRIHDAYRQAVRERMRFFSYGDAMAILPRPAAANA